MVCVYENLRIGCTLENNLSLPGSYTMCAVSTRGMAPEEAICRADHSGPRKRGFFRRVGLAMGRSHGALFEHTRFATLKDDHTFR
jgi:hypothetical protein